jgi:hypothetical protein
MGRLFAGAVAVGAIALLYSTSSQAGIAGRQVRLEAISLDPEQVTAVNGTTTIDCSTITDCQAVPIDPAEGAHNPAIVFNMLADDIVHVDAGIWGVLGCDPPSSPDAIASGDLARSQGLSRIRILFTPPLDDGTPLSIEWALTSSDGTMCPITACQDYASLGTPPPDICPI